MIAQKERKRLLIVEDEPEMVALHRDFLSDQFDLIVKTAGTEALWYVRQHHDLHLAVVDYKLPDVTGIEVVRGIKTALPKVPVIIITAFGSEDVAVDAFRNGARDYVKKPFTYSELMRRIQFCLALQDVDQEKDRSVLTNATEALTAILVQGTSGAKDYRVQRALRFMHANYAADITLDQVARSAGVSRYHFSRLFKEAIGVNYQSYLSRLRIDHARRLLRDDALSITTVGHAAGFSDLTHFERIFKKLVGITPSRFRSDRSR